MDSTAGMSPHPKVVVTTLTGAVTAIVVAIVKGAGDPATILLAALTIAQAVAGYLTPGHQSASKSSIALTPDVPSSDYDSSTSEGTAAEKITAAGAPGAVGPL